MALLNLRHSAGSDSPRDCASQKRIYKISYFSKLRKLYYIRASARKAVGTLSRPRLGGRRNGRRREVVSAGPGQREPAGVVDSSQRGLNEPFTGRIPPATTSIPTVVAVLHRDTSGYLRDWISQGQTTVSASSRRADPPYGRGTDPDWFRPNPYKSSSWL